MAHFRIVVWVRVTAIVCSILLAAFAFPVGPSLAGATSVLSLDRNLNLGGIDGYNVPTWSFDSRFIAFVSGDGVGFVNVATGEVKLIPSSAVGFINALAWSHDAALLAVSTPTQLKVFKISDLSTVGDVDVVRDFGGKPRFGEALQFSLDGTRLLISYSGAGNEAILYSLDWKARQLTTLIPSPFGGRRVVADDFSSKFLWQGTHLYFSTFFNRLDEYRYPAAGQAGAGNPFISSKPSSCYVFAIDGTTITSNEHLDVPPVGTKPVFDDSDDIFDCRYMPSQDAFLMRRKVPQPHDQVLEFPPLHAYYDVAAAKDGRLLGSYAHMQPPDQLQNNGDYAEHPSQPFVVIPVAPDQGGAELLTLWNVLSGEKVDELTLPDREVEPQISPDGARLVTMSDSNFMPIYNITAHTHN